MKNLFYCVVLALFAVAWTANLDRNGHDVEIRAKRSLNLGSWFQTKKDAKKKDKKKKNKKKKKHSTKVTTAPYTIASPSKSPIKPGKIPKMPDDLLEKILKAKNRDEVEKLMGISKKLKKQIEANYTKSLPKELARVESQSNIPAPHCDCSPQYTRISLKHDHTPALGIFLPHNCVGTYRCLGACMQEQFLECRPTRKSIITHPVLYYYHDFVGRAPEQKIINLEYHHECSCQCKPQVCNKRQDFVQNYCSCRCKPEYSPENLNCAFPFTYDDNTCSCKCHLQHMPCEKSKVWNKTLCKCVHK